MLIKNRNKNFVVGEITLIKLEIKKIYNNHLFNKDRYIELL